MLIPTHVQATPVPTLTDGFMMIVTSIVLAFVVAGTIVMVIRSHKKGRDDREVFWLGAMIVTLSVLLFSSIGLIAWLMWGFGIDVDSAVLAKISVISVVGGIGFMGAGPVFSVLLRSRAKRTDTSIPEGTEATS